MGKKSKEKGKRGERELAGFLRELGFEARRGQQFSGEEGRDVITSIPQMHIEVKRVETFNAYVALEQAEADRREDENPMVMHRRNGKPWIAVMYADDLVMLLKELEELRDASASPRR